MLFRLFISALLAIAPMTAFAQSTLPTVAIKCWTIQSTTLTLAIVTAGINLVPATTAPSGTVVQIIAIPPTQ